MRMCVIHSSVQELELKPSLYETSTKKETRGFLALNRNIWHALALTFIHLACGWIDRAGLASEKHGDIQLDRYTHDYKNIQIGCNVKEGDWGMENIMQVMQP